MRLLQQQFGLIRRKVVRRGDKNGYDKDSKGICHVILLSLLRLPDGFLAKSRYCHSALFNLVHFVMSLQLRKRSAAEWREQERERVRKRDEDTKFRDVWAANLRKQMRNERDDCSGDNDGGDDDGGDDDGGDDDGNDDHVGARRKGAESSAPGINSQCAGSPPTGQASQPTALPLSPIGAANSSIATPAASSQILVSATPSPLPGAATAAATPVPIVDPPPAVQATGAPLPNPTTTTAPFIVMSPTSFGTSIVPKTTQLAVSHPMVVPSLAVFASASAPNAAVTSSSNSNSVVPTAASSGGESTGGTDVGSLESKSTPKPGYGGKIATPMKNGLIVFGVVGMLNRPLILDFETHSKLIRSPHSCGAVHSIHILNTHPAEAKEESRDGNKRLRRH
jgi:hypothetical protein